MPIRPENKDRYPKDWPEIREGILEREGHRCKECRVANHAVGYRKNGKFVPARGNIHLDLAGDGKQYPSLERLTYSEARELADDLNDIGDSQPRYIVIVLTIAHLHDDSPENCSEENLGALCQRCHNRLDAAARAAGRKQRRLAKAGVRSLFPDSM